MQGFFNYTAVYGEKVAVYVAESLVVIPVQGFRYLPAKNVGDFRAIIVPGGEIKVLLFVKYKCIGIFPPDDLA